MTAEVAILNTHGVALAADSAVTLSAGGERKVYNLLISCLRFQSIILSVLWYIIMQRIWGLIGKLL
jgi:hypothetical protein